MFIYFINSNKFINKKRPKPLFLDYSDGAFPSPSLNSIKTGNESVSSNSTIEPISTLLKLFISCARFPCASEIVIT